MSEGVRLQVCIEDGKVVVYFTIVLLDVLGLSHARFSPRKKITPSATLVCPDYESHSPAYTKPSSCKKLKGTQRLVTSCVQR
jgi:hypothetical protein